MENFYQFCGIRNGSFVVWDSHVRDFGACFENLVIVSPVNLLLLCTCLLFIKKAPRISLRDYHLPWLVKFQGLLSCCVAVEALAETICAETLETFHPLVFVVTDSLVCLAWVMNTAALWRLRYLFLTRKHLPVFLVLSSAAAFVGSLFQVYSVTVTIEKHGFDNFHKGVKEYGTIIRAIIQFLYLLSLLPCIKPPDILSIDDGYTSFRTTTGIQDDSRPTERDAFLRSISNTTFYSSTQCVTDDLGIAEDNANILSKLSFWWVRVMMVKGYKGFIENAEDLFILPRSLMTDHVRNIFIKELYHSSPLPLAKPKTPRSTAISTRTYSDESEFDDVNVGYSDDDVFEPSCNIKRTLLGALHHSFGSQYYLLGIIKLLSDGLGFAGPLLLHALVSFMENRNEPVVHGYYYASGLFLTTLCCAVLNSQFNYWVNKVGFKMRAAIITTVYHKALAVSITTLARFSSGEEYGKYTDQCHDTQGSKVEIVSRDRHGCHQMWVRALYSNEYGEYTDQCHDTQGSKVEIVSRDRHGCHQMWVRALYSNVVNFMSTDTDRVVNFCPSFHQFWSLPFQIAVSLYLLHQQVGLAFLAGLGFAVLLIPINRWLAIRIQELSKAMMHQKDNRVKMMNEVLYGIRVIKFYAWEKNFKEKINKLRSSELKSLKGRKYLDAWCVYFWATTPVIISILTFTTYVLMGYKLTAAKVFTSVALFNMLISPLNAFPWVLNGLMEAWVSVKRLQAFLALEELDLDGFYLATPPTDTDGRAFSNASVKVINGSFSWRYKPGGQVSTEKGRGKYESSPATEEEASVGKLLDINLTLSRGQLIGVIGTVGSGKSSLLSAFTAEMDKLGGQIYVAALEGGFGLATQEPWIQHATVKENILFGKAYDVDKYSDVIDACALREDLATLPAGDDTEVGENGVNLSGGQKARVGLARVIYQDKDIYLLDDPLAAVDAHVAAHLFQHCIMGLLHHKTVILCTHHTKYLAEADHVIVMEHGTIVHCGPPEEVLESEQIMRQVSRDESRSASEGEEENDIDGKERESRATKDDGTLVMEEEKDVGAVKLHVYGAYWRAIGHCLAASILVSLLLMQASRNLSDWWLAYWISHSHSNTSHAMDMVTLPRHATRQGPLPSADRMLRFHVVKNTVTFYLIIYGGLAISNTVFTLFRAFLFAYGGIKAARAIHQRLLDSILAAPIAFFDVTPIGRIINRFSSDMYSIDDSLPFILNIFLAQAYGVAGTIAITCYGLPWLTLMVLPLGLIYYYIQNYYRRTSRELKRLMSVTLSPMYVHFSETLTGLSTIRALRETPRFKAENEQKLELNQGAEELKRLMSVTLSPMYVHFSETLTGLSTIRALRETPRFKAENEQKLELNQRANFCALAASQWLGLRLQFLGVAMVTGVAFLSVLEHHFHTIDPGLVGLAISYALSVTDRLSGMVTSFTETEKQMVGVERAIQYTDGIPAERHGRGKLSPAWPSQGSIGFYNVVLVYRPGLPPALRRVTFQIVAGEKVGIVGRTGSGKSSLFLLLFRMVEAQEGVVVLDGVNVASLPLDALRSRLAIIPQDPFLFSGTVRDNIDPWKKYSEHDLWVTLERCYLGVAVRDLGGLSAEVGEHGRHFSVGQRQLICLARALLTRAKILCIDEATASVDMATDRLIQQTIREEFMDSTVLTIAHRVGTVMDCDRVLVMDRGTVAELDTPTKLMANKNSLFYNLVNNS